MIKTINPLIKNPLDLSMNEDGNIIDEKSDIKVQNTRIRTLVYSLVLAISGLLAYLSYSSDKSYILKIVLAFLPLLISILFFILSIKKPEYGLIFGLIYSVSSGLAIAYISSFIRDLTFLLVINDNIGYNADSIIVITLGATLLFDVLIVSVFYAFDSFGISNFYYKFMIVCAFIAIITCGLFVLLSSNFSTFHFVPNFLSSILLSAFVVFFMIVYFESIRKTIQNGIDEKYLPSLSFAPITITLWLVIDIFYAVFHKEK